MTERNELHDEERSLTKTLKRAVRRPRKVAPAPQSLRGWAKSAVKARNKS